MLGCMVNPAFPFSGGAPNSGPSAEGAPNRPPGLHILVRRARSLCRREGVFSDEQEALVMVSGGQDSLALLHVLATRALRGDGPRSIRALHVNHHLRGAESDADESLVRERCAALGVPVEVAHASIDKRSGNVQAEARAARRTAALESVRGSRGEVVVLGHTLDDQVETMLYRLGRYGGLQALVGMLPVDPPWVRPFLTARRADTGDYCVAHGLVYAVDRGNEYPGYARTGLRASVVPAWEATLPGAVESAGRAAEVAAEAAQIVRAVVRAARDAVGVGDEGDGGVKELSVARLLELNRPLRRAVLRSMLEECVGREVSREAVLGVEALLGGGGSAERTVGGGWIVTREYGRLLVSPRPPLRSGRSAAPPGVPEAGTLEAGALEAGTLEAGAPEAAAAECAPPEAMVADPHEPVGRAAALECPGAARFGDLVVRAVPAEHFRAHDQRSEAYLDAAAATGPLWVRAPRPGDRMRPLGAPGRRLVQDILVDLQVPRAVREHVPVVGCGECILWLGGYLVAEEGRITPTTAGLIHVTVVPVIDHERGGPPEYGVDGT